MSKGKLSNRTVITSRRSAWQWITGSIWALLVAVVLFAAIAAGLVPRLVDGAALRVTDDAMSPHFSAGDVVVVKGIDSADLCAQSNLNQVIAYLPVSGSPELAMRRVVSKSVGQFSDGTKCRLSVRGEDRFAEEQSISPAQVRGVPLYRVPKLGLAQDWASANPPLAYGAAGTLLLGGWLVSNPRKVKVNSVKSRAPKQDKSHSKSNKSHQMAKLAQPADAISPAAVPEAPVTCVGRHLKENIGKNLPPLIVPPACVNRVELLQNREAKIREHELALREARVAYRESILHDLNNASPAFAGESEFTSPAFADQSEFSMQNDFSVQNELALQPEIANSDELEVGQ